MRQAENQRVAFEKRSSVLAPKSGCQTAAVSLKKTFPRQFGNRPLSSERRIRPRRAHSCPQPPPGSLCPQPHVRRSRFAPLFSAPITSPQAPRDFLNLVPLQTPAVTQGRPAGAGQRQPTAPAAPLLNAGAGPSACLVPCKRS